MVYFFCKKKNITNLYMTCFWDGLLRSLDIRDFQFGMKLNVKPQKTEFIRWLKRVNPYIVDVHWNNQELSKQEIEEHKKAIGSYKVADIRSGHMCSSCDSFLLLVSQIFQVNIQHSFINHLITYTNIKNARKTLRFVSNSRHFQCVRR
jgi:hypothetical protein